MKKKRAPWLLFSLTGGEAIPIVLFITEPRECRCDDRHRIAPAAQKFPEPEERPAISGNLTETTWRAAAAGGAGAGGGGGAGFTFGVTVYPGTGELLVEGFAPTVTTGRHS